MVINFEERDLVSGKPYRVEIHYRDKNVNRFVKSSSLKSKDTFNVSNWIETAVDGNIRIVFPENYPDGTLISPKNWKMEIAKKIGNGDINNLVKELIVRIENKTMESLTVLLKAESISFTDCRKNTSSANVEIPKVNVLEEVYSKVDLRDGQLKTELRAVVDFSKVNTYPVNNLNVVCPQGSFTELEITISKDNDTHKCCTQRVISVDPYKDMFDLKDFVFKTQDNSIYLSSEEYNFIFNSFSEKIARRYLSFFPNNLKEDFEEKKTVKDLVKAMHEKTDEWIQLSEQYSEELYELRYVEDFQLLKQLIKKKEEELKSKMKENRREYEAIYHKLMMMC